MKVLFQFAKFHNATVINNTNELIEKLKKNYNVELTIFQGSAEELVKELNLDDFEVFAFMGISYRDCFTQGKNIKWMHTWATGYDEVLTENFCKFVKDNQIKFTNSPSVRTDTITEHVIMSMMSLSRGLNHYFKNQQEKVWKIIPTNEIHRKTIVIIGFGSIGKRLAEVCEIFNMNIIIVSQSASNLKYKTYKRDQIHDALKQGDFVVLCDSLKKDNMYFFDRKCFESMKRTSIFINIARGKLVKEDEMIECLKEKVIYGASLDVFEKEPLSSSSPLWEMENVIITPHSSWMCSNQFEKMFDVFFQNFDCYINGKELISLVNHKELIPIKNGQ